MNRSTSGFKSSKLLRRLTAGGLGALALLFMTAMTVKDLPRCGAIQTLWSIGVYEVRMEGGRNPLRLTPLDGNPAISAADLGLPDAHFVADPFLFHESENYYLFFEVLLSHGGAIGLATSRDGRLWRFEGIVLAEPFHLSYPHVFKRGDAYYMVPESEGSGTVRLYEAVEFPHRWRFKRVLTRGPALADPTVFQHDGRWWMFAAVGLSELHLYCAAELEGPWQPHALNPIIKGNPDKARPGGAVFTDGERLVRFAQDDYPSYGNAVRAFEITQLSETAFSEREIAQSPLLAGTGSGWNAEGMHHISIQQIRPGYGLAVVDGRRAQDPYFYVWSLKVPVPQAVMNVYKRLRGLGY